MKRFLALLLGCLTIASASTALAAACPDAQEAYDDENWLMAEFSARECLSNDPDNAELWALLARSLAFQEKYEESLQWIDKVLAKYPTDSDMRTQRVRVLAWKGDLDEAWEEAQGLNINAYTDPDTSKLVANIAFWRNDWKNAVERYDLYLLRVPDDQLALRNRGVAHKNLGNNELARRDFIMLCKLQGKRNCELDDDIEKSEARFELLLQPGYVFIEERNDGWNALVKLDARVWRTLKIGASSEYRQRDYGKIVDDLYNEIFGSYRWKSGWTLYGALGFTVDPDFSPNWSAQIEPGYIFDFGLELYLKYWRIQFENEGIHVITPGLIYYFSMFMIYPRYYMSIDDAGDIAHSGMLKLGIFPIDYLSFFVGAGLGDKTEYLEPRRGELDYYYFILAGAAWNINWRHKLMFDYIYRNEKTDTQRYIHHHFMLGYSVKF